MPPSVPGYTNYDPVAGPDRNGKGDPAGAKAKPRDRRQGRLRAELVLRQHQADPQQTNQLRVDA